MSEVKRYAFAFTDRPMPARKDCKLPLWVSASDYDALAKRYAERNQLGRESPAGRGGGVMVLVINGISKDDAKEAVEHLWGVVMWEVIDGKRVCFPTGKTSVELFNEMEQALQGGEGNYNVNHH